MPNPTQATPKLDVNLQGVDRVERAAGSLAESARAFEKATVAITQASQTFAAAVTTLNQSLDAHRRWLQGYAATVQDAVVKGGDAIAAKVLGGFNALLDEVQARAKAGADEVAQALAEATKPGA